MSDLKQAVAQLKAAYLISDYIRNSGVKVTASGPGKWKALCPFHSEKSPSFTISDQFQNYHCWGCGANGDMIKYAMETEHLEFMEVLKKLAEDKGIELNLDKKPGESSIDYKSLRDCLKESANFFAREYRKLPPEHRARKQVTDRGISEKGMVYGYAPENRTSLYTHLKSMGIPEETMLQAGVVSKWEDSGKFSDFWSGRLMFIITDISGKPIGFSGRKLFEGDTRGKFVNSQAGPLFDKSSALFNVQNAKKPASDGKEVFIAEGQFDVAAFIEAGAANVVASSGTAFTQQQGGILQRLVGENGKLIFAFDGDTAGVGAALKVFKNVPSIHSTSWVVQFPEGKDPCDFRQENGNELFLEHIQKRIPLVEFVLEVSKRSHDMTTELGRAKYLEYAGQVLKTVASKTVRESFIRKVALDCFVEVSSVKEVVAKSEVLELQDDTATAITETAAEIPEELNEPVKVDLIAKIRSDKSYGLAARFIAVSLIDTELTQYLPKNKGKLPAEFSVLIDELCELEAGSPIIPEAFTDSSLVKLLSSSKLFPLAHLEGFNSREQFEYLFRRYMETVNGSRLREIQGRVHSILSDSEDDQLELLVFALEAEEKLLKEANLGS